MPDHLDSDSLPQTEPTFAPIFDSGPLPQPLDPAFSADLDTDADVEPAAEPDPAATDPELQPATPDDVPPAPAQSVVVPGQYTYLKRWKLALVVLAVWLPAAAIGFGLYHWWVHDTTAHKTLPVLAVLCYVVACIVGGLMLAMVRDRPIVSAVAIAVMSAPFASVLAAAPLYGYYYCGHVPRCLVGIIPY